ncbi:MAG: hypothetical protein IT580_16230, partial [Verrucomicrobiales bacterium]|nr:hypothetical protein [Verrucomicrobiales bacterium]
MNSSRESSSWRPLGFQGVPSCRWILLAGAVAVSAAAVAAPLSLVSEEAARLGATGNSPLLAAVTRPVRLGESTPLPAIGGGASTVRMPWMFEPADDRAPQGAGFAARGNGYSVFVGSQGALLALRTSTALADGEAEAQDSAEAGVARSSSPRSAEALRSAASVAYRLVGIRFQEANAEARAEAGSPLPGRVHRLRGATASNWQTGASACARVVYRSVYPGIDVAYYGQGRELEYDLIVAAGASPSAARLRFDGVSRLQTDAEGALRLSVGNGTLIQRAPVAYQEGPQGRERVPVSYQVHEDGAVGFAVGAYDGSRPLVIDPVLSYATFLGGSGLDQCWDVAVDTDGSVVVAGETESATFSTIKLGSTNAFLTVYQGGQDGVAGDAFVARLAPNGEQYEWFTYLGGSDYDVALTLGLGTGGEPVVGGFTTSTNFPVTAGAVRTRPTGVTNRFTGRYPLDAFITRLKADGSGLVSSTLLGGDGDDQAIDLTLLGDGRVVVGGSTTSTNFPVTAPNGPAAGGLDGFLAAVSADGTQVLHARYLGGSGRDSVEGVSLGAGGGLVHVVGLTASTNFP